MVDNMETPSNGRSESLSTNFQKLHLTNENVSSDDDSDSCFEWYHMLLTKERTGALSLNEHKLLALADMGYTKEEASIAVDTCALDASISLLIHCISAARDNLRLFCSSGGVKMKNRKFLEEDKFIRIPKPVTAYVVPGMVSQLIRRPIPEVIKGPPYFYYVALAPKGMWDTMSRFFYDIQPEFVDFSAVARKTGCIHNLPTEKRFPLLPLPPGSSIEALPPFKPYWSSGPRDKMNYEQTLPVTPQVMEKIRTDLDKYEGTLPESVQNKIYFQWNLIWTGKNKVAALEPDEIEMLLGFPRNHTRGAGITRADRIKSLSHSFQVDMVAYHLSVLKDIYPNGMNVVSLFSGIGGALVALHRLGIKLNIVVSVEKVTYNRDIVRSWWQQTNQTGVLVDFDDAQQVDDQVLEQIIGSSGGFDLVIGGSPCYNSAAGGNPVSWARLQGTQSSSFFKYFRILETVRSIMHRRSE